MTRPARLALALAAGLAAPALADPPGAPAKPAAPPQAPAAQKPFPRPCTEGAAYRQLDFWLGDWTVTAADGKPAGTSHVELTLADCVVLESWTGQSGYAGKSFNVWLRDGERWEQIWVDNVGGMIKFAGGWSDGAMRYLADSKERDGTPVKRRMTFTPRGTDEVRQLGEKSKDGGTTWETEYDLLYRRAGR